jgi:hypothetical protein
VAQHPPPPSRDLRLRYMFFRLLSSLSFRTPVSQVASNSAASWISDIDKLPHFCPCWMPTQYRPTRLAKRTNVATTPPWSSYSLPPLAPQHPQHSVLWADPMLTGRVGMAGDSSEQSPGIPAHCMLSRRPHAIRLSVNILAQTFRIDTQRIPASVYAGRCPDVPIRWLPNVENRHLPAPSPVTMRRLGLISDVSRVSRTCCQRHFFPHHHMCLY